MFRITKRGEATLLGFADNLRYVVFDEQTKTFYQTNNPALADGIAVQGTVYNIGDEEKISGADFADTTEIDGGEYNFSTHNEIVKNTQDIAEVNATVDEIIISMLEG